MSINRTEEFKVSGERLLQQVKDIVHEGNVRRITIKDKDGVALFEIPLTAGVVGVLLLPVWAAIGAVAALAASYTIAVEHVEPATGATVEGSSADITHSAS
ncbi:MAG: DUF4342 domain-containing protein [Caldisericota bacterium]|jgi:hypothetical protein|nr:DUF4342 domain-containing protein [Caldisericota bacterium]